MDKKFIKSTSKKRLNKLTVFIILISLIATIFIVVSTWNSLIFNQKSDNDSQIQANPEYRVLDALNSAEIARNLASLTRYREQTWINLQAYNSRSTVNAQGSGEIPFIEKPAVINSTIRTRQDITNYTVSSGDTLAGIARDYDVAPDSIRWSNGIVNNKLTPGQVLVIPPRGLNGVVYRIKEEDTINSIATKFAFEAQDIIDFNDLDIVEDLPVGETIFLFDGIKNPNFDTPSFLTDNFMKNEDTGEPFNCPIHCGKFVAAGDVIGKNGNTGWSTGPHLHIEIFTDSQTIYDPWSYINRNNLVWPVRQDVRRITQTYHYAHKALDIGDKEGVDILAIADGEMIYRGCLWPDSSRWSTFGIIIDHGDYYSLYIHLQAPNNPIYTTKCGINLRSQYGAKSIDYSTEF